MAEQNAVATQQGTQLSVAAQVKSMISQDAVKKKFTEVLGQKAPQFLASITNVVAGSAQLKKCPATTIMSAAFVAATYDLPIDSNLGFAAIVPYNNNKYNPDEEERIMAGLNAAKLLIIDDLGAERSTDYALEKVYNIIDSRYLSGKPLILTTNMTLKDMQESEDIRYRRIYDRIFEMCFPVRFAGRSWREKAASKRFDAMKNLMEE